MDAPVENSKIGVVDVDQPAGLKFAFSLKVPENPSERNFLYQLQRFFSPLSFLTYRPFALAMAVMPAIGKQVKYGVRTRYR